MPHWLPLIVNIAACCLVMLPIGCLCLWVSYRLGRRWRLTDPAAVIVLGIAVVPLPLIVVYDGVLLLLPLADRHLSASLGGYAWIVMVIAGWMGMGVARLENLKSKNPRLV